MAIETSHRLTGQLTRRPRRAIAGMNRPTKSCGALACPPDMVGVFVRDQHRRDRLRFDTKTLQTADHFTRPKATVDENARTPAFDNQEIH
jgi:hypothetical protein